MEHLIKINDGKGFVLTGDINIIDICNMINLILQKDVQADILVYMNVKSMDDEAGRLLRYAIDNQVRNIIFVIDKLDIVAFNALYHSINRRIVLKEDSIVMLKKKHFDQELFEPMGHRKLLDINNKYADLSINNVTQMILRDRLISLDQILIYTNGDMILLNFDELNKIFIKL